jgi:acyl-coenzyme A thioesterase PaaI-like protein
MIPQFRDKGPSVPVLSPNDCCSPTHNPQLTFAFVLVQIFFCSPVLGTRRQILMCSARIAFSRHVGLAAGASGRSNFAPLRREVGGCCIKSRAVPSGMWKGNCRSIRWQSNSGKFFNLIPACNFKLQLGKRLWVQWLTNIILASSQPQPQPQPQPHPAQAPPSQTQNPTTKRPIYIRLPIALALTLLTFSAGFIMSGAPAIESLRDIANPPTDEETLSLFTPTSEVADIEQAIFSHPLTQQLLQDPRYIASRPHLKIPEGLRSQNLTGGTLLGPDKIAVPPLQFSTADGSSFVSLQYLGPALCGHPGIVHGGLLATLLDEGLARCCFPALPNKVAVTASLNITYKAPCMAGQVVVLRAETTKVEGRKAWVKGRLETLVDEAKGEKAIVLTEGEALFIEPRQAAQMRRVVT